MKARLQTIYFKGKRNEEFEVQVKTLKGLLEAEAEFLEPIELGKALPEADAVVFPVLIGEAYKQVEEIKKIKAPIIALTSEFGTVAMWDWEIITFLKAEGMKVFAPYNIELTKVVCRSLALKNEMKHTNFLVFQDKPGEAGMQPEIFKRFYWWEERCSKEMHDKFGVTVVVKSFKKLAQDAKDIPDQDAGKVLGGWDVYTEGVSERSMLSTAKLYIALKKEILLVGNVGGVGMNCLNESEYSDTTPCLAYDMLLKEEGILWACEGDTMSLLTEYLVYKATKAPIMMSNLYPFLMGMAALKHEKIKEFPVINEPENCILVAHCGYMGLVPRCFSCEWTLRPRALEIVDENALAFDARMPKGTVTLTKLHSSFDRLQVIEGNLEDYAQYPGSDCRNGAIIRVKNGRKMMDVLYSHHSCIVTGNRAAELDIIAKIFDLKVEEA